MIRTPVSGRCVYCARIRRCERFNLFNIHGNSIGIICILFFFKLWLIIMSHAFFPQCMFFIMLQILYIFFSYLSGPGKDTHECTLYGHVKMHCGWTRVKARRIDMHECTAFGHGWMYYVWTGVIPAMLYNLKINLICNDSSVNCTVNFFKGYQQSILAILTSILQIHFETIFNIYDRFVNGTCFGGFV